MLRTSAAQGLRSGCQPRAPTPLRPSRAAPPPGEPRPHSRAGPALTSVLQRARKPHGDGAGQRLAGAVDDAALSQADLEQLHLPHGRAGPLLSAATCPAAPLRSAPRRTVPLRAGPTALPRRAAPPRPASARPGPRRGAGAGPEGRGGRRGTDRRGSVVMRGGPGCGVPLRGKDAAVGPNFDGRTQLWSQAVREWHSHGTTL